MTRTGKRCAATRSTRLLVAFSFVLATVTSQEINDLPFPFGIDAGDTDVPETDDESTMFSLPGPMQWLGDTVNEWHLNANGAVAFDPAFRFAAPSYDPEDPPFPSTDHPGMIALYWEDLDPSQSGQGSLWGRSSQAETDLVIAKQLIELHLDDTEVFEPHSMFVATYFRIEPLNDITKATFQCACVYNDDRTFLIFGFALLDFYGFDEIVGYNSKDGLSGRTIAVMTAELDRQGPDDLLQGSNVGMPGVYVYNVTDSDVGDRTLPPSPSPTQTPTDTPGGPTAFPSSAPTEMPNSGVNSIWQRIWRLLRRLLGGEDENTRV